MSHFSRVARRALSTESGSGLSVLAGVPEKHATRTVRIYRPTKAATQQGRGAMSQMWRVQFEKMEGGDRWTNPLMGWTSTGDPLSNLGIAFPNKEAAVEYAKRNGYAFNVIEPEEEIPNVRKIEPFKRAMIHHWRHQAPIMQDDDEEEKPVKN